MQPGILYSQLEPHISTQKTFNFCRSGDSQGREYRYGRVETTSGNHYQLGPAVLFTLSPADRRTDCMPYMQTCCTTCKRVVLGRSQVIRQLANISGQTSGWLTHTHICKLVHVGIHEREKEKGRERVLTGLVEPSFSVPPSLIPSPSDGFIFSSTLTYTHKKIVYTKFTHTQW